MTLLRRDEISRDIIARYRNTLRASLSDEPLWIDGSATGCPAQIVSLQKLQGQLHDKGALKRWPLSALASRRLSGSTSRKIFAVNAPSPVPHPACVTEQCAHILNASQAPDQGREWDSVCGWKMRACIRVNQGSG